MRKIVQSFIGGSSVTAGIATNSTGDKYVFPILFKAKVRKVFASVQGTSSNSTAAVIKFDKRPTAGSDTSRGDGDCGTLTKTASTNQQGKFLYAIPTTLVEVNEGDEIVAQVTTADGAANAMWVGIELERIPEEAANNSKMTDLG